VRAKDEIKLQVGESPNGYTFGEDISQEVENSVSESQKDWASAKLTVFPEMNRFTPKLLYLIQIAFSQVTFGSILVAKLVWI
jgi:hypothetical protein